MGGTFSILALVAIQVAEAPPASKGSEGPPIEVVVPSGNQPEEPSQTSDQRSVPLERAAAEMRVIASCEAALGEGQCTGAAPQAPWQATVRFSESDVEVVLTQGDDTVTRRLPFSRGDNDEQRLVAAGLLVAAMTASAQLSSRREPVPPPSKPSQDPPPSPPAPSPPAPSQLRWSPYGTLDLGARLSPLITWDNPALGASLHGAYWFHERWGATVGVSASQSLLSDPRARAGEASVGVSLNLLEPEGSVAWILRGQSVTEALVVDRVPGAEGSAMALRTGGSLALLLTGSHRAKASALVPFLGIETTLLGPRVEITRDGEPLTDALFVRAGLSVGISWKIR